MNNELKCPHCYFTSSYIDFPDLFCDEEQGEQYELLQELQRAGYNIVTCGKCGQVFITKDV